jgi:hypothetical protein
MVTLVKSEAFRGFGGVSTVFVGGLLDELDENVGRVVGGKREARDESEEGGLLDELDENVGRVVGGEREARDESEEEW